MPNNPKNPMDQLADPFKKTANSGLGGHWDFFETAGIEFHLPWFLSKFMVLKFIAIVVILGIFIPTCQRIATGDVPRGRLAHGVEAILLFIRNQIAIPTLGEHDYKRFLPFLWT